MNWLGDHWLDILGWGGSALLVFSLLQASVLRLRTLNLVACVILLVFNVVIGVWPMVGMNAVLAAINVWFIVKLLRERHDDAAFTVVEVGPADEYLRHVLRVHGTDILRFQPDFVWDPSSERGHAFYEATERMGLEGMVSKRASYRSGRTESWLKIKCYEETDYEVAAVLREPGRPNVAYMVTPDKERRYVGGAFITLNEKMRERLWARVSSPRRSR